ncbi:TolC family protein [Parashewanella curva]|uniref:TolC family protein n=1 Tax=Parashewanella curva TaxID=2338552 RepID=A0A3L8Q0J4_9GAMM|nr:TolC family protein [Parashewanella curva]RLV59882.1 TolC family protein [Parashewanella curva]
MTQASLTKSFLAIACSIALAGCSSISLKQVNIEKKIVPEQWRERQQNIPSADIGWEDLHNPILTKLIANSLTSSPDLNSAELALRLAKLQFEDTDSQQGINYAVNTSAGYTERKDTGGSESFSLNGQASYEVDFWGKKNKQLDIAQLRIFNSEINLEIAHITLVANLVDTYFEIVVQDQRLALLNSNLQDDIKQLAMIKARHKAGLITSLDVANKEVEIESTKARIEDLHESRQSNETRLANLQGIPAQKFQLADQSQVELPELLLVAKTPLEVLRHRPDIQIAEANLKSSYLNFDLAKDSIFPNLKLDINTGVTSNKLSDFIKGDIFSWTAAANVAVLLLDSGARERNIKRAKINAEQQVTSYRRSMLNALKEVEDALSAQYSGQRQLKIANAQLNSQQRLTRETALKYKLGAVSAFDKISQDRALVNQQESILQQKLNNLKTTIRLLRALGIRPTK